MVKQPLASSLSCFVFCSFLIFGPKIGYADLSLLVPTLVFLLLGFSSHHPARVDGDLLKIGGFVFLLLTYQLVIQSFTAQFDVESSLRLARAGVTCLLLASAIGSRVFSSDAIVGSTYCALAVNSTLIIFAALFEPINMLMSEISGNDRIRHLRASGLLSGFDMAGLIALIGLLMTICDVPRIPSRLTRGVMMTLFVVSIYFTSRVTMAIAAVIISIYILRLALSRKVGILSKIPMVASFVAIGLYVLYDALLPLLEVTFNLGFFDVSDSDRLDILSRHAQQDETRFLWSDMIFFPDNLTEIVFGTGAEQVFSDVGYVKDVYRYGIIGVIFSIFIYVKIYSKGRQYVKKKSENNFAGLLLIIYVLIFSLTWKNNYFFTRNIFPLVLLLGFSRKMVSSFGKT